MANKKNNTSEKSSNQSSDKLLKILECLSKNRLPIRLQDLGKRLHMSQSTILRYLNALQNANYIYQEDSTSRYALTWKICGIAENINSNLSLRSITAPFINELVGELNLGVCLVVEQDLQCIYLDCIDPTPSFGHTLHRIGKLAPMHATGSGKLLMSQFNKSRLEEYVRKIGLEKFTDTTITNMAILHKELEKVKKTSIGLDNQECEAGLRCVSSPLINYSGSYVGAISVFGDFNVLNDEYIKQTIIPELQSATEKISLRLGYEGSFS